MRVSCLAFLLLALAVATFADEPKVLLRAELERLLAEADRKTDGSEFKAALSRYEEARCLAEALPDPLLAARSFDGIARTLWALGDNAAALIAGDRSLLLLAQAGDLDKRALAFNNVGLSLYTTGRHAEALGYYELGLEAARSPATRALLLLNIGLVYRYQGRFRDSEAFLQESLALRRTEDNPRKTALTLNALGMLARVTGRFTRALDLYREALALRRKANDRFGAAQTLNNMANVYSDQGELEKALGIHRETLQLAEEIGYARQIALSYQNIGAVLDDLGRPEEGFAQTMRAAELERKRDDRSNLALSLSNAGGYLVELKRFGEARETLQESLNLARAIGEPDSESNALQGLGEVALEEHRPAEALASFDAALGVAEKSGLRDFEWKIRFDRARSLSDLGRREEGVEELRRTVRLLTELRTLLGTDAGKIGFADRSQGVFERLSVELSATGREDEALEAAEAARARALADLLSQRSMRGKPEDQPLLEEIRSAQARERNAQASAPVPDGRPRGAADLERPLARLKLQNRELASLVAVDSPDIREIQAIAARLDATLVEYFVTEDSCRVWVVRPGATLQSAIIPIGRESLRERVRTLRTGLEAAVTEVRLSTRISRELRELDRLLIEPVALWLPADPGDLVVLVPHGPLALLPYSALTDEKGRPLAERHTLSVAPAISVFRYTAARVTPSFAGSRIRALVVADPVPPSGSGLPRLPGARREAVQVARRLGSQTEVLAGGQATEAQVKMRAGGFDVLHFATHGLISEDRPLESSIVLGEGSGEDGYLRVDEIFGLDLHAGLVTLSGCRTGIGRLSGDGILGLTRAFLYAGTPSLVVAQWDVSDRGTAALMDRFYLELRQGRGKAAALRTAQLAARRRGESPARWATFVLVGEPR